MGLFSVEFCYSAFLKDLLLKLLDALHLDLLGVWERLAV